MNLTKAGRPSLEKAAPAPQGRLAGLKAKAGKAAAQAKTAALKAKDQVVSGVKSDKLLKQFKDLKKMMPKQLPKELKNLAIEDKGRISLPSSSEELADAAGSGAIMGGFIGFFSSAFVAFTGASLVATATAFALPLAVGIGAFTLVELALDAGCKHELDAKQTDPKS